MTEDSSRRSRGNKYLDEGISDASDSESGYDSERVIQKSSSRGRKRRKLSHSSDDSNSDSDIASGSDAKEDSEISEDEGSKSQLRKRTTSQQQRKDVESKVNARSLAGEHDEKSEVEDEEQEIYEDDYEIQHSSTALARSHSKDSSSRSQKEPKKKQTPGVVYLSSLPPYLKPSALRNLLSQRGFSPITRLFLTPASKHKSKPGGSSGVGKKSSRQLYTEGWIEFASKKTAKRCAEALNAQAVGGRKGGFYYDDLWNMRYLKGMAWEELMAGIREEKREEEGRRDEERRRIAAETKRFVEGVEEGRRLAGMKRKKQRQVEARRLDDGGNGERSGIDKGDVQRVWRQHEVARDDTGKIKSKKKQIDPEVQQVLSQIF